MGQIVEKRPLSFNVKEPLKKFGLRIQTRMTSKI